MNDIRNKPLPPGENGPSNSNLGNSAHSSQSTSAVTSASQPFLGGSQGGAGLGPQSNSVVGAAAGARPGGMPTPSLIVSSTSDAVPVSFSVFKSGSDSSIRSSSYLFLDISC